MIREAWEATDNETSRTGLLMLSDDVVLNKIRDDGFAIQNRNFYNEEPRTTSALAVPISSDDGKLIGSLGLIYFASALRAEEAVVQFLKPLQKTAELITANFEQS